LYNERISGEVLRGFNYFSLEGLIMAQRGRPVVYGGARARHIVALVRHHNARNAMKILNATPKSELGQLRNQKLFPTRSGISMPTILKLAHAAGVELKRGRPVAA